MILRGWGMASAMGATAMDTPYQCGAPVEFCPPGSGNRGERLRKFIERSFTVSTLH